MPVLSAPTLPAVRVSPRFLKRLLWNLLPAALVVGVLADAFSGDEGIFQRHLLKQRVIAMQADVAAVESQNLALAEEINALRSDPEAVTRAAAEELMLAPEGATVYRFSRP